MNPTESPGEPGPDQPGVLEPGRNCWALEPAERLSVVVDTAGYFAAFAEACAEARHQILILGWDFDRRERLHRDDNPQGLPDELGEFLVALVRRRPELKVYLLSWDFNMIYAAERELLPALRLRLQAPPRFHFRLDGNHPNGASHHQKVVVIDDRVAFVGGIDLSRWRWDTCEHKPDDPRRVDPNGKPYPPFHDMMMVVEGRIAARLGDLARARWRRARGWRIKPPPAVTNSPWPASVEPGVGECQVAVARTEPRFAGREAVREVERLYLDAIESAREFIYIENQYFTARSLTAALAARLQSEQGPEVVLVLPLRTGGWLEQVTMDVLRGRMVQRLHDADKHQRLRVYFPTQPGLGEEECISVHAKLMIVDDHLLRVGSSNASARSMGLDTECDLAVEASDGTPVGEYIRTFRRQLIGEHLDCTEPDLARAESEQPGLIAAIESLRGDGRSLRPLDCAVTDAVEQAVPESALVDPSEPLSPDYFVTRYVPDHGHSDGRRRLLAFMLVVAGLLAMAAAWRWTPLGEWLSPKLLGDYIAGLPSAELRALVAVSGFLLASLAMVPLTVLAVIGGLVFESWLGFAYVLGGALGSSALGFAGGRMLSQGAVDRLSGSRLEQLSKRLAERGAVAVAVLRLIPIAPFSVFNLVAGASHLGFWQFMAGSLMGLTPGLAAITLFSGSLWSALTQPSWASIAVAAGLGLGLAVAAALARRWLRSG